MKSLNPISITGVGAVTCAGIGVNQLWKSALKGESGIHEGLGHVDNKPLSSLKKKYPVHIQHSRAALFAAIAIDEAIQNASWHNHDPNTALVVATTAGQISLWENQIPQFLSNKIDAHIFAEAIRHQSLGSIVETLKEHYQLRGPSLLITSACSASAQALIFAASLIRSGQAKRVIVGGVETLSHLTIEGFRSLKLISNDRATPFDVERKGINLSEGAAFLTLEASDNGMAYMQGHGMTSDAYHMTAPHPEGTGIYRAMSEALNSSQCQTEQIDWLHAHGTGSLANDHAEGFAINQLFGLKMPPVSSTKWLHGHMLGASGALETVLCVKALEQQCILPNYGLTTIDPGIPIVCANSETHVAPKLILKTTLGFGGNNAALVLSREQTL